MHVALYEVVNRLTPGNQYPALLPTPAPPADAAGTSAACFVLTEVIKSYVTAARKMQGEVLNSFDPFQGQPGLDPHTLGLTVHTASPADASAEAYGQERTNQARADAPTQSQ